jgi:hypothetical protein
MISSSCERIPTTFIVLVKILVTARAIRHDASPDQCQIDPVDAVTIHMNDIKSGERSPDFSDFVLVKMWVHAGRP